MIYSLIWISKVIRKATWNQWCSFVSIQLKYDWRCEMFFFVSEQILHNIKQEYKRLQKRRHLDSTFQQADGCCPLDLPNVHHGSALPGTYKRHVLMRISVLIYQSSIWAERVKSKHRLLLFRTKVSNHEPQECSLYNHYFTDQSTKPLLYSDHSM